MADVYDEIRAELAAVPEEEQQAAVRYMEAQTAFPGWTTCPFGGWALWILKAVYHLRQSGAVAPDEPTLVQAKE